MTYLYKLYSKRWHGTYLLYIGISDNWPRRMTEHAEDKVWFSKVNYIKVRKVTTRDKALKLEKRLIEKLNPKYNIQHKKRLSILQRAITVLLGVILFLFIVVLAIYST